jgi:PadR family transcriptional regulator PadR
MSTQGVAETLHQGIVTELRRGFSVVLVLARLGREQYGYTLLKELDAAGLPVDQNTLYPLLRRLESQGLLSSAWKVEEGRPRRYYARTTLGGTVLKGLRPELIAQRKLLEEIDHETR